MAVSCSLWEWCIFVVVKMWCLSACYWWKLVKCVSEAENFDADGVKIQVKGSIVWSREQLRVCANNLCATCCNFQQIFVVWTAREEHMEQNATFLCLLKLLSYHVWPDYHYRGRILNERNIALDVISGIAVLVFSRWSPPLIPTYQHYRRRPQNRVIKVWRS